MTEDAELLAEFAAARSEAAFTELVRRHIDFVFRSALRRVGGDSHLAEDVTQAVFIALARDAARLRDHAVIVGWLYSTTRHVAAQTVRTERRRKEREQAALKMNSLNQPPSHAQHPDPLSPELDEALDALSASDREAILLRFFERAPFATIGSRLGISDDASRMRVDRALERLRRQLARRGVTSTAAALGSLLAADAGFGAPAGLATAVTSAALSGSAAAASGTGVAALLQIMTTTKTAIVAATVVCGVAGLVSYEMLNPGANREPTPVTTTVPIANAAGGSSSLASRTAVADGHPSARDLAAFFSGDPKAVVARMRAAGYPIAYQGGVAAAFVNLQFDQRVKALPGYGKTTPFWKASPPVTGPEYLALRAEMTRAREEILAQDYSTHLGFGDFDDPDWLRRNGFDVLPLEKARALWALRTGHSQPADPMSIASDPARAQNQRSLRAAIEALLTPEELLQYDLRASRTADLLRDALQGIDYTEQDFITLFRIRQPFDVKWDGAAPNRESAQQRREEQQKIDAEIEAVLGPERTKQYRLTSEGRFQTLLSLTDKLQLPKSAAFEVAALQKDLQQKLATARSLPESTQAAALSQIGAEAEQRMTALLGADGFSAYRSTFSLGAWMAGLPRPTVAKEVQK